MFTFTTPEPVCAVLDLVVGNAVLTASTGTETVVRVEPADPSRDADVRAAEQTEMTCEAGRLVVRTPKPRGRDRFGRGGTIEVAITLPAGSDLDASAAVGALTAVGRLGTCRIHSSVGDVRVEDTTTLDVHLGAGKVTAGRVAGDAVVRSGTGRIIVGEVAGAATIKSSDGDIEVGAVSGDLRVRTARGDITVARAGASLAVATAKGDLRVGEVAHGSASLKTGYGEIEIGIAEGTAAQLDVRTDFGQVRRLLDTAPGPESAGQTADVRARTGFGDVVLRRSPSGVPSAA